MRAKNWSKSRQRYASKTWQRGRGSPVMSRGSTIGVCGVNWNIYCTSFAIKAVACMKQRTGTCWSVYTVGPIRSAKNAVDNAICGHSKPTTAMTLVLVARHISAGTDWSCQKWQISERSCTRKQNRTTYDRIEKSKYRRLRTKLDLSN